MPSDLHKVADTDLAKRRAEEIPRHACKHSRRNKYKQTTWLWSFGLESVFCLAGI